MKGKKRSEVLKKMKRFFSSWSFVFWFSLFLNSFLLSEWKRRIDEEFEESSEHRPAFSRHRWRIDIGLAVMTITRNNGRLFLQGEPPSFSRKHARSRVRLSRISLSIPFRSAAGDKRFPSRILPRSPAYFRHWFLGKAIHSNRLHCPTR